MSLVVAVTLILGASAHAADPAEVERLLQEGIRLRREGSDGRALPLFQKAYDLAHTPRSAAQLGLVEFALGYSVDAATHLSQGLAASNDIWIRTNRAALERTLVEVRATIGDVEVTGTPPGADVLLDGKSAGQLPLASAIPSNQGPATVELRAGRIRGPLDVNLRRRWEAHGCASRIGARAQPCGGAADTGTSPGARRFGR